MNKNFLALICVVSFSINTANARLIDDFSDGMMHVEADSTNVFKSSTSSFGGGRSVSINATAGDGAKVDVIGGFYAHSVDALVSANSRITWSDASTLGIDLIESKNNVFALDIFSIDQGSVEFTLSITDKNSSDSVILSNAAVGIQNIAFSAFTGINFHEITDISLQMVGEIESDFVLNSLNTTVGQVSAVPIPPALILFTSSLALLSMGRRKAER